MNIEKAMNKCMHDMHSSSMRFEMCKSDYLKLADDNEKLALQVKGGDGWLGVPGWGWLLIGILAGGAGAAITIAAVQR
jgi:hypothetical protein